MTSVQTIGVILVRFWAVHLFIQGLRDVDSYVAWLVVGAGLFILAKPFVRGLMPRGSLPALSAEAERRWLYSGTALIGVYLLVRYLPYLLGAAVIQGQMAYGFVWQRHEVGLTIAVAAVAAIVALTMIFRVRHFVAWRTQVNQMILRNFTPKAREESFPADDEPPGSSRAERHSSS